MSIIAQDRKVCQMEDENYIEKDDDGDIFELINEECYYDDIWLGENGEEE